MRYEKLQYHELVQEPDKDARADEIEAGGIRNYTLGQLALTWLALEAELRRNSGHCTRRPLYAAIAHQKARIEAEMLPALDDCLESTLKAKIAAAILARDLRGTPFAKALLESAARDIERYDEHFPKAA